MFSAEPSYGEPHFLTFLEGVTDAREPLYLRALAQFPRESATRFFRESRFRLSRNLLRTRSG
ncbi:hypothetical protein FJ428_30050 [Mesorhizobium sp. B2-8-1]|nr:hypothetical protein FJ428_30050 [Mesorhizobium sp. B2-8-1]